MALKDLFRNLTTNRNSAASPNSDIIPFAGEQFPVVRASEIDLTRYRKLPLTGVTALGAAFSRIPEAARTLTTTVSLSSAEPLFRQINPKNIVGYTRDYGMGTSGNIIAPNAQGRPVIAGRMRYQRVEGLPLSGTTTSVMPFDPMTLAVAAALMSISQQLDDLQQKAEAILQFLKAEKQSRQRGNLNTLTEMMETYKQEGASEKLFNRYISTVTEIKRESFQDIDFYQNRVNDALLKQQAIHGTGKAHELLGNVMAEFREYQLACYLYGYSTLMETLLTDEFGAGTLNAAAARMSLCSARYNELFAKCHEQLESYQSSALQNRLMGDLGSLTRAMGEKLASVPVLSKGTVDEAMIAAGDALAKRSRDNTTDSLKQFAQMEDSRIVPFIESIQALETMVTCENGLLTDGENLYTLLPA